MIMLILLFQWLLLYAKQVDEENEVDG